MPTELVVSSWGGIWDAALRRAVSDPFTADTGIRVRHDLHIGLDLPAPLLGTARAGCPPPYDVVWSNAVAALRADRAELCDRIGPDDLPSLGAVHPRIGAEFAGRPMAVAYVVPYVLVFRRAVFPDGPPDSWHALLDPRHCGKVALYPDGNGIHAVAQVMGAGRIADIPVNMDACWSVLRRLRPQVRELDYSVGMEERLRRGELDLCFRALPNALGFRAAGADVGWVAPREGVPATADALWIPRRLGGERVGAARAYIDWALSRDVHQRWCDALGVIPVRTDVEPPQLLRASPRTPCKLDDARLLHVADTTKFEHEDAWRARFRAIFRAGHDASRGSPDP